MHTNMPNSRRIDATKHQMRARTLKEVFYYDSKSLSVQDIFLKESPLTYKEEKKNKNKA